MSFKALRKLQGSQRDSSGLILDNPPDEETEDEDENDCTLVTAQNRFHVLGGDSLSESEVKEDDDLTETGERGDSSGNGTKQCSTSCSLKATGVRKKRRKKKKKGSGKVPGSSDDYLEPEIDEIEKSVQEVNALLGEVPVPEKTRTEKGSRTATNLLAVEHRHLNPQNEMKRIFGAKVVQGVESSFSNKRRGRGHNMGAKGGRTTWIVQGQPQWAQQPKPGITMKLVESTPDYDVFKYQHSTSYQKAQKQFLEAVQSLDPENIMNLLNVEPFHVDTLLQVSEIFRLADDSAMAPQLVERAIYVLESVAHPLFSITSGTCRLPYKQQENRCFYITLFRHTLNVGQKGCYRTALELCKLLLSLSPDEDPLAVSLMLDFYAVRAQEYAWLVALYDLFEPTKNLSMLPNYSFSVPLALFHLSQGEGIPNQSARSKQDKNKANFLFSSLGTQEEMKTRADNMLQKALIMFPGVLMPLLSKCNVQPDPTVESHSFFGLVAQSSMNKGLSQIVSLYVGRNYHVWKEAGVMDWLEENVKVVLARVDSGDPIVQESQEHRQKRYHGTPTAIYRHILLAEIKDSTAALPPNLANGPIMSYDPLPPPDSVCDYIIPTFHSRTNLSSSSILASFFSSIMPSYQPNSQGGNQPRADGGEVVEDGAVGEETGGTGGLRASVTTLLDAMRELLSNIHATEAVMDEANHADHSEEENGNWN